MSNSCKADAPAYEHAESKTMHGLVGTDTSCAAGLLTSKVHEQQF